jgi:N-carbamoyl-L-amino-acid hydrolase
MMKVLSCLLAYASAQLTPIINSDRLNESIGKIAEFGRDKGGGSGRVAYTEADILARAYSMELMKSAGLEVKVDTAGNLVGYRAGHEPGAKAIIMGSHIDTVPGGGRYDGVVGSLGAIEVAHAIQENKIDLRHPLQVMIFSNEEGGHLGSRAVTTGLTVEDLGLVSLSGKKIEEGIRAIGGRPDRLAESRLTKKDMAAYLELHIEQGGLLEARKVKIGVVEGVVGIRRWDVTVLGIPNHGGTTPMSMRKDALLGAAEFIVGIRKKITALPGHQVGTVGKINVDPGAPNVIPGLARFTLEFRDTDTRKIERLAQEAFQLAKSIEKKNATPFRFQETYNTPPVLTDDLVKKTIEDVAKRNKWKLMRLPSGAGHDAQEFARLGPIGMIFIPSRKGISHSPEEFTESDDIGIGAQALYETLIDLDRRL